MSREVVIVPCYGDDPRRVANADRVLDHLRMAGFRTLIASPQNGASMAHARNLGAEISEHEERPASVLVFNDADSIVPPRQILEAVHLAATAPGLVYAYDLYLRLDERGRIDQELFNPPSMGCVAISRDCFTEAGGFDQRFVGWGYEDVEFAQRCGRLWPLRRVPGVLEHLWHGDRRADDSPVDADPELVVRNLELWSGTVASTL